MIQFVSTPSNWLTISRRNFSKGLITAVKAPKSCHITPILRSLHWLRITKRIEYKLLSPTYKVLTTIQPPYLHNVISTQRPRSTRSSSVVTLARPPSSFSLKITDRSFRYASPCIVWGNWGWLEFAGVENDRPAKNRGGIRRSGKWRTKSQGWNTQDCKFSYPGIGALVPCGHARFCENSARRVADEGDNCPLCRAVISMVMRVFA